MNIENNKIPSRDELMNKLRELDFAIIETAMFLDSHPMDKKALTYYHDMLETRNESREVFTKNYGPLCIFENNDNTQWQWVKGPWPWELED